MSRSHKKESGLFARAKRKLKAMRRGARHSRKLRGIVSLLAIGAALFIVAVGVLCLVIPHTVVHVLPYLLGFAMAFSGFASIAAAVRRSRRDAGPASAGLASERVLAEEGAAALGGDVAKEASSRPHLIEEEQRGIGVSFVLLVLGAFSVACGERSIGFLGVAWGLITLYKIGGEFDEVVALIRQKKQISIAGLAFTVLELILALLLILNPFENIEHHVIVLGIELVLYPFKLHHERGKMGAEVEA